MRNTKWSLGGLFLITALGAGCGPQGESLSEAEWEGQLRGAAASQTPTAEPSVIEPDKAPRLASLETIPQETLSSKTKTLIRARLAEGVTGVKEIPTFSDSGSEPLLLRDDGTNGDEKAGDGLFSAMGTVDFAAQMKQEQRIADFQNANGSRLTEGTFEGRQLVTEKKLEPVSSEVFRPFTSIPFSPHGIAAAVDPARSLIIRDASVISDSTRTYNPCTNTGNASGAWTFNTLMTEMANQTLTGITPAAFTLRWLKQWETAQSINGWSVPARTAITSKIITPWPKLASGELDMTKAPFKLVAIFNRLDLGKGNSAYSSAGAGELRFVFAAADRSAGCTISNTKPLLVIFEFGVPKKGCPAVKTWAQQWANLSTIALGSASFNPALEALTSQVVLSNAAPGKPNGSAINQVRTNDFMLQSVWEFREFRIFSTGAAPGHLTETTTVLTPSNSVPSANVASYINTNTAALLAGTHTVPLLFAGSPFLGANSLAPSPGFIWSPAGVSNNNARHKFSFNTCNGCHAGEVNTPFMHISPSGGLSPFLSGPLTKVDPVDGVTVRTFNEVLMRQQHLDSTANQSCLVRAMDVAVSATAFAH